MISRDTLVRIAIVTIASIVLWLWAADGTTRDEIVKAEVQLDLAPEKVGDFVLIEPHAPFTVQLSIKGSEAARQAAGRFLSRPITLEVGDEAVPDGIFNHEIDGAAMMRQVISRADIPVTVVACTNQELLPRVELEELRRATAPVLPILPNVRLAGDPVVDPSEVEVQMPKSSMERAGRIRIEAAADPGRLDGLETGRAHTLSIPLRAVFENPVAIDDVTISPATARVTFTLAARTSVILVASEQSTDPGIPVQVALPPEEIALYTIAIDEKDAFLRNVQLTGPTEQLDLIQQGRFKVLAFVQLTSDDLDRAALADGRIEKQPSLWSLPPGVSVVDPGRTDYQLEQARSPDLPRRDGVLVTVRPRGS